MNQKSGPQPWFRVHCHIATCGDVDVQANNAQEAYDKVMNEISENEIRWSSDLDDFTMRIPTMPITHSDLMAITIPSDADHRRSEATLGISNHAEVIGIRQCFCN